VLGAGEAEGVLETEDVVEEAVADEGVVVLFGGEVDPEGEDTG